MTAIKYGIVVLCFTVLIFSACTPLGKGTAAFTQGPAKCSMIMPTSMTEGQTQDVTVTCLDSGSQPASCQGLTLLPPQQGVLGSVGLSADGRSVKASYTAQATPRDAGGYRLSLGGGSLIFRLFGQSSSDELVAPSPADTQWHHLAATYDGATMTMYLDGKAVKQKRSALPLVPNTGEMTYGQFSGALESIKIYPTALRQDEIAAKCLEAGVCQTMVSCPPVNTPCSSDPADCAVRCCDGIIQESCLPKGLPLQPGWNTIFIPTSGAKVTNVDQMMQFEGGRYVTTAHLATKKGYALFAKDNAALELTGLADGTVQLHKGWNLIGIPATEALSAESVMIDDATGRKSIESAQAAHLLGDRMYVLDTSTKNMVPMTLSSHTRFLPGTGYFIEATSDVTLTVAQAQPSISVQEFENFGSNLIASLEALQLDVHVLVTPEGNSIVYVKEGAPLPEQRRKEMADKITALVAQHQPFITTVTVFFTDKDEAIVSQYEGKTSEVSPTGAFVAMSPAGYATAVPVSRTAAPPEFIADEFGHIYQQSTTCAAKGFWDDKLSFLLKKISIPAGRKTVGTSPQARKPLDERFMVCSREATGGMIFC